MGLINSTFYRRDFEFQYFLPAAAIAARSCRNPLKGAKPVPGPIMTNGIKGSAGNLNVDLRQ